MKRVLCLLLLFVSASVSAAEVRPFRLGLIYQFDNKYDRSTHSIVDGIDQARREFEKAHPEFKVEVLKFSHGKDLSSVAAATNEAVKAKVDAVLGGEISEESIVIGDILNQNKIVFVTATSSNPAVLAGKDYAFTACFSDRDVAAYMARFVSQSLKPTKIGVIQNISSPYTNFLASEFLAKFKDVDPERAAAASVAKIVKGTYDFDPIVTQFKNEKVSHVIMLTHDSDLLRFTAQAAAKSFYPAHIGSDGWGSNTSVYRTFVKESTAGNHFIGYRNSYWNPESTRKAVREFKTRFQKQFHRPPDEWNAVAHDAATVLLQAAFKSAPTFRDLRSNLKSLKAKDLATTPTFAFNSFNSPEKTLVIHRIDKRGINYEKTVE